MFTMEYAETVYVSWRENFRGVLACCQNPHGATAGPIRAACASDIGPYGTRTGFIEIFLASIGPHESVYAPNVIFEEVHAEPIRIHMGPLWVTTRPTIRALWLKPSLNRT